MAQYTIDFGTTIYGGSINVTTGILTSKYNADGTEKATPDIIQLTPQEITAIVTNNFIYGNTNGNTSVTYLETIKEYIDKRVNP